MVAAGGIPAVLNPISNEPKTAAGQLENLKTLFGTSPVLTSHKLAAIFASKGLNVKTIEQVTASPLSPKPAAVIPNNVNGDAVHVNGDAPINGAHLNGNGVASPTAQDDLADIAVILFTSGSTGHSKAVKFSHAQLISSVVAKSNYLGTKDMTFMSWICMCPPSATIVRN